MQIFKTKISDGTVKQNFFKTDFKSKYLRRFISEQEFYDCEKHSKFFITKFSI